MTTTAKKGKKQVRVYLEKDDEGTLAELLKLFGGKFTETDIMGLLVSASMRAIRDNHGRIVLPLTLSIVAAEGPRGSHLTEPKPPARK